MNKRRRWKAKARRRPRARSLGTLELTGSSLVLLDMQTDNDGVIRLLFREGEAVFTRMMRPSESGARSGLMRLARELGGTVYEPVNAVH